MAFVIADRVKERTTTTGTGTVTLTGAATGFQSFSAIGNANTTYYAIVSQTGTEWEVGLGTYTSSGTTLDRTTVIASSNGGSAVNFSAGTKDVFVTYPSGRAVLANSSLTSGRVTFATTSGFLTDSANLTFSGTILTAAGFAGPFNGTVGATTASTGAFTSITASTTITATGAGSIQGLTVGRGAGAISSNTVLGTSAFSSNTSGSASVAIGQQALLGNLSGANLVAVGFQALLNNTASNNTAVGYSAGYSNTSGATNVLIGLNARYYGTSGSDNVAVGVSSMAGASTVTTGSSNTAIGTTALLGITTASNCTALGASAGAGITTGSNNTYLGYAATQSGVAVTGEIVLCTASTTGKGSNTGYVNASSGVYQGNNLTVWSITSDQRIKKNIVDVAGGLDKILALRPVEFDYKETGRHDVSFIAQEYQEVFPDQVTTHAASEAEKQWVDEDGKVMGINQNLVPYLVKAIQELKAEFDAYKSTHP
jgi:hypothetical protein